MIRIQLRCLNPNRIRKVLRMSREGTQSQKLREYVSELSNKQVIDRLPELFEPQSDYTPEQKVQVACIWLSTGSAKEAADVTGVNHATIRDWVSRKAWWPTACDLARKVLETKLDKTLDGLLRQSLGELQDRLDNGDDIVTKDGTVVKRRVGARDCAIISDILFNKRAALRGQPGNITERRDATTILDLIRQESGKHGKAKIVEIDPATIIPAADALGSGVRPSEGSGAARHGSPDEPSGAPLGDSSEADLEQTNDPAHINPEHL